jgi:YfiH family protein
MSHLETVQSKLLSAVPGVRHAFFTRSGGISQGVYDSLNTAWSTRDDQTKVAQNRIAAQAWFDRPTAQLKTCSQVHSAQVVSADAPWDEPGPQADAVVTAGLDRICGVLTADCAPVLIADPATGLVGAAHAGWKGAIGGIVEATVGALVALGGEPDRMIAAVGPCIGPKSYEVGQEFRDRFVSTSSKFAEFFVPGPSSGHFQFDLPAFVLSRLHSVGVTHCEWTGQDTYSDSGRFFSNRRALHREEPDFGRLLSAICRVPS